jgi:hypothetical protein
MARRSPFAPTAQKLSPTTLSERNSTLEAFASTAEKKLFAERVCAQQRWVE